MPAKTEASKNVAEFVISREFNAPRDLMWKAWTEQDRMAKWFGPKGFTTVSAKNDLRPGGTYHYALRGHDGSVMWGRWIYREIVKPSKLVWVNSFSDEGGGLTRRPSAPGWPRELLTTVTFEESGGKTKVTVRWLPINASDEEISTFDKGRASMTGGWTGTLERLEAYLGGEMKR
jgi:uncharacterized protein YndB with AHSA1/START domain